MFLFVAVVFWSVDLWDLDTHRALTAQLLHGNLPPRALNDPRFPLAYHAVYDALVAIVLTVLPIDLQPAMGMVSTACVALTLSNLQALSRVFFRRPGSAQLARALFMFGFGPVFIRCVGQWLEPGRDARAHGPIVRRADFAASGRSGHGVLHARARGRVALLSRPPPAEPRRRGLSAQMVGPDAAGPSADVRGGDVLPLRVSGAAGAGAAAVRPHGRRPGGRHRGRRAAIRASCWGCSAIGRWRRRRCTCRFRRGSRPGPSSRPASRCFRARRVVSTRWSWAPCSWRRWRSPSSVATPAAAR